MTFQLMDARAEMTELEPVLAGCDVVICNSGQLVNILSKLPSVTIEPFKAIFY